MLICVGMNTLKLANVAGEWLQRYISVPMLRVPDDG